MTQRWVCGHGEEPEPSCEPGSTGEGDYSC